MKYRYKYRRQSKEICAPTAASAAAAAAGEITGTYGRSEALLAEPHNTTYPLPLRETGHSMHEYIYEYRYKYKQDANA